MTIYLYNGISYTGKMASLYWIGAQVFRYKPVPGIYALKPSQNTVKCRYNAFFGVQEIDRVIAVTAL